jgi:hypothetical protein
MSKLSWSYSMFSCALNCLACFEKQYILKLPQESKESGDLIFGSAVHSAINASLTGGDAEDVFAVYWGSYQHNEDIEYGRFKWAELKNLGYNFCRKFTKMHRDKYELELAEQRLYSDYKGVKLEGTPDFIGRYNGRGSLRDFKTSGYNYEKERSSRALQLYLYAYLSLGKVSFRTATFLDTLGYTVFNKGTGSIQDLTWEFDEKVMYSMLDDMVTYCKLFETLTEYPRNPNCTRHNYNCYASVKE